MKNRCHYLQTSYLFSSVCIYGYWSQRRQETSFNAHAATFTEITQHFPSVTYDAVCFLTPPSLWYGMRHRMWSIYTGNTLCCSEEAFERLYFCVACVYVLREKKTCFSLCLCTFHSLYFLFCCYSSVCICLYLSMCLYMCMFVSPLSCTLFCV